jgi:hypothetical protein
MQRRPKCGETKPLAEFAKDATKSGGYASRCKLCDREKGRRYYAEHRAQKIAKAKAYAARRREIAAEERERNPGSLGRRLD